jgi:hypothetical protein
MPRNKSNGSGDDMTGGQPGESRMTSDLRARLQAYTKEQLVALVERVTSDSPELAARIDYLTDHATAVKSLQRHIAGLRNGRRFVSYRESGEVAEQIASLNNLRVVAPKVLDFYSQPSHEEYEVSLRANHGRKTSFWALAEGKRR